MSADQRSQAVVRGLPKWILGVAAIFVFANVLLFADRSEQKVYPSVNNPRASGLAVLMETLRAQGFEVVQDRSSLPVFRPNDVILWPRVDAGIESYDESSPTPEIDPDSPFVNMSPAERAWARAVAHVNNGGATVILNVESSYREQLSNLFDYSIRGTASSRPAQRITSTDMPTTNASGIPLYSARSTSSPSALHDFVTVRASKKGKVFSFDNASFLTNRLIDKAQNADAGLEIFRRIVPAGSRLVVVEADLFNIDDPSLWQAIGPYASAAYWQFIGLAAIVIYTLGRRFGPPYTEPVPTQASRELVDAYGHLLYRARRWDLAAKHIYEHLDMRCRRALRLSAQATIRDRDVRAGAGVEASMRALLSISTGTQVSQKEFRTAVQHALAEVEFLEREARGK